MLDWLYFLAAYTIKLIYQTNFFDKCRRNKYKINIDF